jgi:indole-3-glycerol phosphate synthase
VRDLDSLAFRPDVAQATFASLAGKHPVLGLSGVEGPEEARRFRRWGAHGILVGGAFARSVEPGAFLARLRRSVREEAR